MTLSMCRAVAAAATIAVVAQPVLVHGSKLWTLRDLGYGSRPHVVRGSGRFAFRFRLPPAARQGEGHWYVLRLHVRVWPDLRSFYGTAMINPETGRRDTCGGAFVHIQRLGAAELVSWNGQGSYAASRRLRLVGSAARPAIEGTLDTPCLAGSLRGGVNTIVIAQSRSGEASFRTLTVYPDTGLYLRRVPPAPRALGPDVKIEPLVPERAPRRAARMRVPFRVIRSADVYPGSTVVVRVKAAGALRLVRARRRIFLPAGQGAIAHGEFVVRARRRGSATVSLSSGDQHVLLVWRLR